MDGGTYFFTVVTHRRRRFLCEKENVSRLWGAFQYVMTRHTFKMDAFVLLPDHMHCIWTLPQGDSDYSMRWRLVKSTFTRTCDIALRGTVSESRRRKGERAVWQRRFWEHQIRDERDFIQHLEYIHYNPAQHGVVDAPKEWAHSSFLRYAREGFYSLDWGVGGTISFGAGVGFE